MVGKIESLNPVLQRDHNSTEVVQVRNNTVISYPYNPDSGSGGNYETLRQSLKSPVDEVLEELYNNPNQLDFDNWIEEYKHYYEWKQKYFPFELKKLGTVSNATQKRMRKLIETAVNAVYSGYDWKKDYKSQPYITFLTTTLPSKQMHSDKVLKRAFTLFLENLVKTYNVCFYLWKAEAQTNGNIHFHVLIDRFVDHGVVRRLWNNQMDRLGYISKFAENMTKKGFTYNPKSKKSREIQHLEYLLNKKEGFKNPNSTDIHSLKGIKNPAGYMIKYMTKSEENKRPIIGRVWGYSRNIKFLKYPEFVGDSVARRIIDLSEKHLKRIDGIDFVLMYKGGIMPIIKRYANDIYIRIRNYYKQLNKLLYYEPSSIKSSNRFFKCFTMIEIRFKTSLIVVRLLHKSLRTPKLCNLFFIFIYCFLGNNMVQHIHHVHHVDSSQIQNLELLPFRLMDRINRKFLFPCRQHFAP